MRVEEREAKHEVVEVGRLEGVHFLQYWPAIAGELRYIPHVWSDWWTLDSIHDAVLQGAWQCWVVGTDETIRGVVMSQIVVYPANRIFQIVLAFGEGLLSYVPHLEGAFEKFASDSHCTLCEVTGRPGWGPHLRRIGFHQGTTTFTKTVRNLQVN